MSPIICATRSFAIDTGVLSNMVKIETAPTRSPRGTKPVSEAFFAALGKLPATSHAVVAKAAQAMIRDELKTQRDKVKAANAKQKLAKPVAVKARAIVTKPVVAKQVVAAKSSGKAKTIGKNAGAATPAAKLSKAAKPVQAKKAAAAKPAETAATA